MGLVVVLVCVYGNALSWAANAGVVLGFDLMPDGFRSQVSSWPFDVATGVFVGAASLGMWSYGRRFGGGAIVASGAVATAGLAFAITITVMGDMESFSQTSWQRFALFAAESPALAVFSTTLIVLSIGSIRPRQTVSVPSGQDRD